MNRDSLPRTHAARTGTGPPSDPRSGRERFVQVALLVLAFLLAGALLAFVPTPARAQRVPPLELSLAETPVFRRSLGVEGVDRRLVVVRSEERDGSGAWHRSEERFLAPFAIAAVASASSHTLVLAGETTDGVDVLEAWWLPQPEGSYATWRPLSLFGRAFAAELPKGSSLGFAQPSAGLELALHGEAFVPPEERGGGAAPARESLLAEEVGGILDLALDADGRYAILLTGPPGSRALLQLELVPGARPRTLASQAGVPALALSCALSLVEGPATGRSLVVALGHGGERLVALDPENDGVFAEIRVGDP